MPVEAGVDDCINETSFLPELALTPAIPNSPLIKRVDMKGHCHTCTYDYLLDYLRLPLLLLLLLLLVLLLKLLVVTFVVIATPNCRIALIPLLPSFFQLNTFIPLSLAPALTVMDASIDDMQTPKPRYSFSFDLSMLILQYCMRGCYSFSRSVGIIVMRMRIAVILSLCSRCGVLFIGRNNIIYNDKNNKHLSCFSDFPAFRWGLPL